MIAIDHASRIGIPAKQRPHGVPLAADMVAVLAAELVELQHLEVFSWIESLPAQEARVGSGSPAENPPRLRQRAALQIGDGLDGTIRADHNDRSEIAIGVAHRDGFRLAAGRGGDAFGLDPGQRRVPGDVNLARELRVHLPLVV